MSDKRIEKDSLGDVPVPSNAYYGAQTQSYTQPVQAPAHYAQIDAEEYDPLYDEGQWY